MITRWRAQVPGSIKASGEILERPPPKSVLDTEGAQIAAAEVKGPSLGKTALGAASLALDSVFVGLEARKGFLFHRFALNVIFVSGYRDSVI